MISMDKFLNIMKLSGESDEYDEFDDIDEIEEEEEVKKFTPTKPASEENYRQKAPITRMNGGKYSKKPLNNSDMEVRVVKPLTVEDAREITATLLSNRTVILNLEGIEVDIAQRILDFTSGSCYAINGNLQKISHYIFIITPETVDISGDLPEIFTGALDAQPINNSY